MFDVSILYLVKYIRRSKVYISIEVDLAGLQFIHDLIMTNTNLIIS